ncbi:hypothetical protein HMPREF9096_00790 [Haemophilus sp. oral taxon 851 str. F0397]|nr:hypothetical protein HMPREF9096_00790 [Haemophilus sp. oral taxon 851 str. F0397]
MNITCCCEDSQREIDKFLKFTREQILFAFNSDKLVSSLILCTLFYVLLIWTKFDLNLFTTKKAPQITQKKKQFEFKN